jgi:hypothetical protein
MMKIVLTERDLGSRACRADTLLMLQCAGISSVVVSCSEAVSVT